MIKPHGADALKPLYVQDAAERQALAAEAETLPSLLVSSATAANAVMMGGRILHTSRWLHEQSRCRPGG